MAIYSKQFYRDLIKDLDTKADINDEMYHGDKLKDNPMFDQSQHRSSFHEFKKTRDSYGKTKKAEVPMMAHIPYNTFNTITEDDNYVSAFIGKSELFYYFPQNDHRSYLTKQEYSQILNAYGKTRVTTLFMYANIHLIICRYGVKLADIIYEYPVSSGSGNMLTWLHFIIDVFKHPVKAVCRYTSNHRISGNSDEAFSENMIKSQLYKDVDRKFSDIYRIPDVIAASVVDLGDAEFFSTGLDFPHDFKTVRFQKSANEKHVVVIQLCSDRTLEYTNSQGKKKVDLLMQRIWSAKHMLSDNDRQIDFDGDVICKVQV